ncbi:MAG: hypothetical protein KGY60_00025 [Bacteroidales bacterium]|nr:hypothetical protein [Bacteroidales bacterium]
MNGKLLLYILIALPLIFSCKSSNDRKANDEFEVPDSVANKGVLEVSDEAMENITENISSHIETAALIKDLNAPFSKDYLAPAGKVDNYNTNFEQALILGVYGADMGYLNMYNKTTVALDYLSSIRKMANSIKVGQFFDFATLHRLAKNNEELDSLMYITQRNFNQMDQYLRENNRSNLSTLMVAGGWIEGLYLSGQVYRSRPDEELREAIGEQKIILGDLMILMRNFESDPDFKNLIEDFENIHQLYQDVTITIEQGEPTRKVVDGRLVIEQNTKSIVNVSDELLERIIKESVEIRNKIINQ